MTNAGIHVATYTYTGFYEHIAPIQQFTLQFVLYVHECVTFVSTDLSCVRGNM